MDLFEASKFYGDYRLAVQNAREELPELFDDTIPQDEKILTCVDNRNTLE